MALLLSAVHVIGDDCNDAKPCESNMSNDTGDMGHGPALRGTALKMSSANSTEIQAVAKEELPSNSTNENGVGEPHQPALVDAGTDFGVFENFSGTTDVKRAGDIDLASAAGTVWEHYHFGGYKWDLTSSSDSLGPWNDEISSFIVNPGYCITFFEHGHYKGAWWRLCAGTSPYWFNTMQAGWNDVVSSFLLAKQHDGGLAATVFEHTHFSGAQWHVRQSSKNVGIWNDHISSLEVNPFYCITLYSHVNYGGTWMRLCAGSKSYRIASLVSDGWNDKVSSFWLSRRY